MDIAQYRQFESLARQSILHWNMETIYSPHIFEERGVPIRANNHGELIRFLDTMHDNRFDLFVNELGGLDDSDVNIFSEALFDFVKFFNANFSKSDIPVPLSTMMAHLALYKKIAGYGKYCGGIEKILEIGPGCGYLSFFLKNLDGVKNYSQIEVCEAFYMVQHLVNRHVYGDLFRDHVVPMADRGKFDSIFAVSALALDKGGNRNFENTPTLPLPEIKAACSHYPWWRVADVLTEKFDVITSNANLNEFTHQSLLHYIAMMRNCLTDKGALIVQCFGGGQGENEGYDASLQRVFGQFLNAGFVAVCLVAGSTPEKKFALPNAVLVKQGHPLYEQYASQPIAFQRFDPKDALISSVYLDQGEGERRLVSRDEILAQLMAKIGTRYR